MQAPRRDEHAPGPTPLIDQFPLSRARATEKMVSPVGWRGPAPHWAKGSQPVRRDHEAPAGAGDQTVMQAAGTFGASMTGSGSAVFGLFPQRRPPGPACSSWKGQAACLWPAPGPGLGLRPRGSERKNRQIKTALEFSGAALLCVLFSCTKNRAVTFAPRGLFSICSEPPCFAEHPAQVQSQAKVVLPLRGVLFAPVVGFGGPFQRLGRKARPVVGDRQASRLPSEAPPGPTPSAGRSAPRWRSSSQTPGTAARCPKTGALPLGEEVEAALSPQDGAGFRQLAAQVGKPASVRWGCRSSSRCREFMLST